jgi:hypothetical protein
LLKDIITSFFNVDFHLSKLMADNVDGLAMGWYFTMSKPVAETN